MKPITLRVKYGEEETLIDFPCSEAELGRSLQAIGAENRAKNMYFVKDAEFAGGLQLDGERFLDLDEINYLAKRLDSFTNCELDRFYAVMAHEKITDIKRLINLTFNPSYYTLIQNVDRPEKIGREHYMTLHGGITKSEEEKIDFAKTGRELISSGKLIPTDYGLLYRNEEIPFAEVYDGNVFPFYDYDGDTMLTVEMTFGGKTESLYLPCEEIAIKKAFKRLGACSQNDCRLSVEATEFCNRSWYDRFRALIEKENIANVNELMKIMNDLDFDLTKYEALLNCANDDSIAAMIVLAERSNEFEYIPTIHCNYAVGKYIIDTSCDYELSEELEDFFDFEGFGKCFAEEHNGQFIDGGFLYGEKSVEEILQTKSEIKMGGI